MKRCRHIGTREDRLCRTETGAIVCVQMRCVHCEAWLPLGPATHTPIVNIEIDLAAKLADAFDDHAQEFNEPALSEANDIFIEAAAGIALDQIEKAITQARRTRSPLEQMIDVASGYEADREFWRSLG